MVVLSVLAILLAMGMPAFGRFLHDVQIRGSAEGLRAALQTARAEAVTRNAAVRISIGDANGMPAWSIGCVRVSVFCPNPISTYRADAESRVRWGAMDINDTQALSESLGAGSGLPARLTFNALGAAPGVVTGDDVSRIDIMHLANAKANRLVITIAAAGAVSLCDPSAASDSPNRCV